MTKVKIGLTGSIGMGKSTTAAIFAALGCDVWDADVAVHKMYAQGGRAVALIEALHPAAVSDGSVDRMALKDWITAEPSALKKIEQAVHPLIREDRENFIAQSLAQVLVFDIPLLYETDAEDQFDYVACVLVNEDEQKRRVMDRGTMSEDQLDLIISKQLPASVKAKRADFTIPTDTYADAQKAVQHILSNIKQTHA